MSKAVAKKTAVKPKPKPSAAQPPATATPASVATEDEKQALLDAVAAQDGGAIPVIPPANTAELEAAPRKSKGAPGIAVTTDAKRGRWRAGREFPRGETVTIALADLSEEQLDAIRNDPVLTVTAVTIE